MGNGIAVIILQFDQSKFDKRLSTRGISRTAYLGRLIHTLSNMINIVLIEEEDSCCDEESMFDDESEDNGQSMMGESSVSDTTKSDDLGIEESEFEDTGMAVSDSPVAWRSKDIRNKLGKSAEFTNCGNENVYAEFELSRCQINEKYDEERSGYDTKGVGVGEREGATKTGEFSDMYSEPESSDCQMAEEYGSQDEMDTNEDDTIYALMELIA